MESKSKPRCQEIASNTFEAVLTRRLARRSFLKGGLLTALLVAGPAVLRKPPAEAANKGGLTFRPVSLDNQDGIIVAEGYEAAVLLRWGDPLFPNAAIFDPLNQSRSSQQTQFGYNCDFVGYLPFPDFRSTNPRRALLFVNHEYTNENIMFPAYDGNTPGETQSMSRSLRTVARLWKSECQPEAVHGRSFKIHNTTAALPAKAKSRLPAPPQAIPC